ncbi:helix-turn-helix domain-containing protein [Brachybacterium sp. AOP43-C2-M15]|uniref:helix-turn-helix domain-containing protein n=1 Tax=Brachybacterium sp. AOP43-C2-M15 TaxID=3457661 RepID=UPI0040345255
MAEDVNTPAGPPENSSARSVADKVMALVQALGTSREPLRLATLAEVSGTSKATARRLLLDLCTQGYAHSPGRGLYLPGPRLQGLAASVVRQDPLGGVIAETLSTLARATGHVALRLGVAGGRAVVLALENPQRLPIPLQVGDELPAHARWGAGSGTSGAMPPDVGPRDLVEEYPTASSWMLSAPADADGTSYLALVGLAFLRPQDDTAAQLLRAHARALGGAGEDVHDVG